MGFFDKIKNLFIEEPEEPIKKEFIPVEIASPKVEEKKDLEISDATVIKRVEKIRSPVFFSDKDFEDLETNTHYKRSSTPKLKEVKEQPKVFKPSPIISPVYGIVEDDYKKDNVVFKKETPKVPNTITKGLSIDEVRKKAYGTLEEELESSLLDSASMLFKDELIIEDEIDLFEELKNKDDLNKHTKDEPLAEEIEEISNLFKSDDQLTEEDLFDLVNSMYEKGEEVDG